ncbi:hypothetical protein [Streptomyces sp. NPDC001500]
MGAVSLGYAPHGKRRRPKVYGKTKAEVRQKSRDWHCHVGWPVG